MSKFLEMKMSIGRRRVLVITPPPLLQKFSPNPLVHCHGGCAFRSFGLGRCTIKKDALGKKMPVKNPDPAHSSMKSGITFVPECTWKF